MVQIKFITTGANSAIGSFGTGDKMRCGEEMAAHFVKIGVAAYDEKRVEPAPVVAIIKAAKAK